MQTGGAPTPASAPSKVGNLWEAGRLTKVQRPEPPPGSHRPPGSSRAFEGSSMFFPGLNQTLRTQIPQWFFRSQPFTHYLVIPPPPGCPLVFFTLYLLFLAQRCKFLYDHKSPKGTAPGKLVSYEDCSRTNFCSPKPPLCLYGLNVSHPQSSCLSPSVPPPPSSSLHISVLPIPCLFPSHLCAPLCFPPHASSVHISVLPVLPSA